MASRPSLLSKSVEDALLKELGRRTPVWDKVISSTTTTAERIVIGTMSSSSSSDPWEMSKLREMWRFAPAHPVPVLEPDERDMVNEVVLETVAEAVVRGKHIGLTFKPWVLTSVYFDEK